MCGHPSLRSVCVESKTNATQSAYKERIRYAVVRSSIVWERLERSQKGRRLHLGCMNTRIHVCSYVYLFLFFVVRSFFYFQERGWAGPAIIYLFAMSHEKVPPICDLLIFFAVFFLVEREQALGCGRCKKN